MASESRSTTTPMEGVDMEVPTSQQVAILRELIHRERFVTGRRAALRHEVTRDHVAVMHPGHLHPHDLPRSGAAARNCLVRMVDRGWVKVFINGRQRTYGITDAGREAARPHVL